MRLLALAFLASLVSAPAMAAENRCGILSNPTPGNWWLLDRDGEWIIGTQGSYQAEGIENIPESLFERGWVRTNGYYGYRCACLGVETERKSMRVRKVLSGRALPMQRCNADPALRSRR